MCKKCCLVLGTGIVLALWAIAACSVSGGGRGGTNAGNLTDGPTGRVSPTAAAVCMPNCTTFSEDVVEIYTRIEGYRTAGLSSAEAVDSLLSVIETTSAASAGGSDRAEACRPCAETVAYELYAGTAAADDTAPPTDMAPPADTTPPADATPPAEATPPADITPPADSSPPDDGTSPEEPGLSKTEPDPDDVAEFTAIEADLKAYDDELMALLLDKDEEAAKLEMAEKIAADPAVEWAVPCALGVSVQYENGLQVVMEVTPNDTGLVETDPPAPAEARAVPGSIPWPRLATPTSKKTLLLNPNHWERKDEALKLIETANKGFKDCGLHNFTTYLNEQATIERFEKLEGYGVVHIYSHGFPWPTEKDAQKVYVMTGQITDPFTSGVLRLLGHIPKGRIEGGGDAMIKVTEFPRPGERNEVYCLSAEYVAGKNDLTDERSLVYLGFCHSWDGNWQDQMLTHGGAMACVGFEGAVDYRDNANWAKSMYGLLCDTTYWSPVTLGFWYDNTDKSMYYLDTKTGELSFVALHYSGSPDLTLWEKEEEEELGDCTIYDGWGRWHVVYDFDCDGEIDSDNLWHFREDHTISDHWLGEISGTEWQIEGNRIFIYSRVGDTHREATVSDDCQRMEDGGYYHDDGTHSPGTCWWAERG